MGFREGGLTLELGRYLSDIRLELLDCVEQNDMLFLRWNLYGLSRAGRKVIWPGSGMVRFDGEQIDSCETFFDYLSLLKQLELVPGRVWQTLLQHGVVRGESPRCEQRWIVRQGPESCPRRLVLMPGAVLRAGSMHKALEALERLVPLGVLIPGGSIGQDGQQTEFLLEPGEFGILIVDHQDRILEVNRTAADLLGQSVAEMVGTAFHHWLSPAEQGEEKTRFLQFVEQHAGVYPVQVKRLDGCLELWTSRLEQPEDRDLFLRVLREPAGYVLQRMVAQHERQREFLAYDLHDGLAQDLASLWVSLQAKQLLARREGQLDHDPHSEQAREMLREVRSILRDLRNPLADGADLAEALQEWAADNSRQIELELAPLEPLAELLCYRLIVEGMKVTRSEIALRLERHQGMIRIHIRGKFLTDPPQAGWRRLKFYCESLGGQFQFNYEPEGPGNLHLSLIDPEFWEMGANERETK